MYFPLYTVNSYYKNEFNLSMNYGKRKKTTWFKLVVPC